MPLGVIDNIYEPVTDGPKGGDRVRSRNGSAARPRTVGAEASTAFADLITEGRDPAKKTSTSW